MNTPQFDHEKLNVYQHALEFVAAATDLLDQIPKRYPYLPGRPSTNCRRDLADLRIGFL